VRADPKSHQQVPTDAVSSTSSAPLGWPISPSRKIARQLWVSTAALYRHFPGRDCVVAAISTVAARELAAEMDQAAHAAGPDSVEQLAATAGANVRYVVRRCAGLNVIFAPGLEHLHDEELVDAGRDLVGLLVQLAENTGRTTADALVPTQALSRCTTDQPI
jgi:AcrR family transcriptional regulator